MSKVTVSVSPFTVGAVEVDGSGPTSAAVLVPSTLCSGSPASVPGVGRCLYIRSAASPVTACTMVAPLPIHVDSTNFGTLFTSRVCTHSPSGSQSPCCVVSEQLLLLPTE